MSRVVVMRILVVLGLVFFAFAHAIHQHTLWKSFLWYLVTIFMVVIPILFWFELMLLPAANTLNRIIEITFWLSVSLFTLWICLRGVS